MATPLAAACARSPFSNGTESEAWIDTWCAYCTHDHGMTHYDSCGEGCDITLSFFVGMPSAEFPWPEALLPEPDDGAFHLPSRMICARFEACTQSDCAGDPGAVERAERVEIVTDYWRRRGAAA